MARRVVGISIVALTTASLVACQAKAAGPDTTGPLTVRGAKITVCQSTLNHPTRTFATEFRFVNASSSAVDIDSARLISTNGVRVLGGPYQAAQGQLFDVYPTELMPKELATVWSGRSALGKPTVPARDALVVAFEVQLEPGVTTGTAGRMEIVYRSKNKDYVAYGTELLKLSNRRTC